MQGKKGHKKKYGASNKYSSSGSKHGYTNKDATSDDEDSYTDDTKSGYSGTRKHLTKGNSKVRSSNGSSLTSCSGHVIHAFGVVVHGVWVARSAASKAVG